MIEAISLYNTATKQKVDLNMYASPDDCYLDYVDWGTIQGTHHEYKFANQVGTYVTSTSLGNRDVEIVGFLVARTDQEMTDLKNFYNLFVNPQQEIEITYEDYVLRFLPDTTIRYGVKYEESNDKICKFKISGYCPDPLFADKDDSAVEAATTVGMFHFPLAISDNPNPPGGVMFGLRTPSMFSVVTNKGDVSTGMKIVFKAFGAVVNPYLVNVKTQEFFKVNKTMRAGEEIEIETTIGKKYIRGKFNRTTSNYFKYRDLDSSWLQLEVGDNVFRYGSDDDVELLEVYIYFQNKYLEVQECK